ncbi:MAG TPA: YraN family protein [Solirubrobacteraceae bacterium]|nr:YraN family protein [Solirubrobacteraceae bacterium]
MGADRRHRLGAAGESLAVEHLVRLGYRIVERNFRTRLGELDIVALDGRTLAFCEVKTRRRGGRTGGALEAVTAAKRARVRRMAAAWLAQRSDRPYAPSIRFDAIAVTVDGAGRLVALEHLRGVF